MYKEKLKKLFSGKEFKIYIVIAAISLIAFFRSDSEPAVSKDGLIKRGEYYEKDLNVELVASIEDVGEEPYEINVSRRKLSKEELDEMFDDCYPILLNKFLNGNDSLELVTGNLTFFDQIEGYPFEISFISKDRESISSSGELLSKNKGETTVLCTLKYDDWEKELELVIHHHANETDSLDIVRRELDEEIKRIEEESAKEEYLSLPKTINGHSITYEDIYHKKNPIILTLGLVALLLVKLGSRHDRDREKKKTRDLIEQEYPIVLQKMIMYLSSGMNLRNAWIKIYEDSVITKKKNPLYEEINRMINELKTGISEEVAYMNLSMRIAIPAVTRFTSLLSQNLRKGSTDLTALLNEEAKIAFDERKRRARIKGEEAGTKLLLPMMMLMIVVMVLIMVPAFVNM